MTGVCDVCLELDGNSTIKYVRKCETCNATMCEPCYNNWIRRGMAALKRQLKPKQ